eukprot:gene7297-11616_t
MIVIGVSGGADSLSLALLSKEWVDENSKKKIQLEGLIVDHGIRDESGEESKLVSNILTQYSIQNKVVPIDWSEDESPITKKQLKCRKKRLEIFEKEVRNDSDGTIILLGHHLDDQIETILYRFSYQSGLVGLGGIPFVQNFFLTTTFVRPFLEIEKDRLKTTCMRFNQKWIEDPSNAQIDSHRGKIREFLPKWYQEGIEKQSFIKLSNHYKKHRSILNSILENFFKHNIRYDYRFGYATIKLSSIHNLPDEIFAKVIYNICAHLRNSVEKIVEQKILNAIPDIRNFSKNQKRAVGGFHFSKSDGTILITREYQVNEVHKIKFGEKMLWDDRFLLKVEQYNKFEPIEMRNKNMNENEAKYKKLFGDKYKQEMFENKTVPGYNGYVDTDPDSELIVRKMTSKDWDELSRMNRKLVNSLKSIPHIVKFSVPVILDKKGLLAIPVLGYKRQNDVHIHWKFDQKLGPIPTSESYA